MADEQEILNRWRLVLGKYAQEQISFSSDSVNYMDMERVLDYLYSREYGDEQEVREERRGGREGSQLTVPGWLHKIKKLFPKRTVEILERHALEKYNMTELLTDPDVLRRLEPNKDLLKTILELKHMMKGEVLQEGGGGDCQEAGAGGESVFFWTDQPQCLKPGEIGPESGHEEDHPHEPEKL